MKKKQKNSSNFNYFKNPQARKLNFSLHSIQFSVADNLATIFYTVLQLRKNFETLQEVKRTLPKRLQARQGRSLRHGREERWVVRSSWQILAFLGNHPRLRRICRHFSEIFRRNRSKKRWNPAWLAWRRSKLLTLEFIHGFPTSNPSSNVALSEVFLVFFVSAI